jgi:hypothetical protein
MAESIRIRLQKSIISLTPVSLLVFPTQVHTLGSREYDRYH